jgi:hypothetical protein
MRVKQKKGNVRDVGLVATTVEPAPKIIKLSKDLFPMIIFIPLIVLIYINCIV